MGSTIGLGKQGLLFALRGYGAGIALLGVITASLASWFVERMSDVLTRAERDLQTTLRALALKIQACAETWSTDSNRQHRWRRTHPRRTLPPPQVAD